MAKDTSVPKPKNQGGHGSAPTQPAKVQKKSGPVNPGKDDIKYSVQPKGFGGSKKS